MVPIWQTQHQTRVQISTHLVQDQHPLGPFTESGIPAMALCFVRGSQQAVLAKAGCFGQFSGLWVWVWTTIHWQEWGWGAVMIIQMSAATPMIPCESILSATRADPQGHSWMVHHVKYRPWSRSIVPSRPDSSFSLNLMGQGMEAHCLSKNVFMSLLLWVLADVICCLYYLVKMLISQPQRGVAFVIDSALPLDMLKGLQSLDATLPRFLHSSPSLGKVKRRKLYSKHLVTLFPWASTMSHAMKDGKASRYFISLCLGSTERSRIHRALTELVLWWWSRSDIRLSPNCPWKSMGHKTRTFPLMPSHTTQWRPALLVLCLWSTLS